MKYLKNLNMDIYRMLASIMIVAIHIYPLAAFHDGIDYLFTRVLFRIAVPLFLMITGYYLLPKAETNLSILKKYTIKIIKIYIFSILLYLPINLYNGYFQNFSILSLIKDIFITGTFYHLWYFPALLYGLWILYFILKIKDKKYIIIILAALYIIGLFGDSYYGLIENIAFIRTFYNAIFSIFDYTRNGLFYTPIFLYIGYHVKKDKKNKLSENHILYIGICICLLITEGMLIYGLNLYRHNSMYISLIPLSITLFSYLLHYNKGTNKKIRNDATMLYILHPFFIIIIHTISSIIQIPIIYQNSMIQFILVLSLTLLFIFTLNFIKNKSVIFYKKKNL